MDTLALFLRARGLAADRDDICICIQGTSPEQLGEHLAAVSTLDQTGLVALARRVANKQVEKWDWALSDELLAVKYASRQLDAHATRAAVARLRRPA